MASNKSFKRVKSQVRTDIGGPMIVPSSSFAHCSHYRMVMLDTKVSAVMQGVRKERRTPPGVLAQVCGLARPKKSNFLDDAEKPRRKRDKSPARSESPEAASQMQKIRILRLPPYKRTPAEVAILQQMLCKLSYFYRSLGHNTQVDFARAVSLQELSGGSVVFRQGEPGERFYVIASGKVEVQVAAFMQRAPGRAMQEINTALSILSQGETFGDIALLKMRERTATIVTKTRVQLLSISKEDFIGIMFGRFNTSIAERARCLTRMYAFQGEKRAMVEKMASFAGLAVFAAGTVFQAERDQRVCFIYEGTARIIRGNGEDMTRRVQEEQDLESLPQHTVEWKARRALLDRAVLCELRAGNFFGESCVFQELRREWYVEATTELKLLFVSRPDVVNHMPGRVKDHLHCEAEFRAGYHDDVLAGTASREFKMREAARRASVASAEAGGGGGRGGEGDGLELEGPGGHGHSRGSKAPMTVAEKLAAEVLGEVDEDHDGGGAISHEAVSTAEAMRTQALESFKDTVIDSIARQADGWDGQSVWPPLAKEVGRLRTDFHCGGGGGEGEAQSAWGGSAPSSRVHSARVGSAATSTRVMIVHSARAESVAGVPPQPPPAPHLGSRAGSVSARGARTEASLLAGSRAGSVSARGARTEASLLAGSRAGSVSARGARTEASLLAGSRAGSVSARGGGRTERGPLQPEGPPGARWHQRSLSARPAGPPRTTTCGAHSPWQSATRYHSVAPSPAPTPPKVDLGWAEASRDAAHEEEYYMRKYYICGMRYGPPAQRPPTQKAFGWKGQGYWRGTTA